MITIIYDPKNGATVPDGLVDKFVDDAIESGCEVISIGSGIILTAFRLAHIKGRTQIVVQFEGQLIGVCSKGNLGVWPRGLDDYHENYLSQLCGFYS